MLFARTNHIIHYRDIPSAVDRVALMGRHTRSHVWGLSCHSECLDQAPAPGSLTQLEYLQLLSFLLVQNNYAAATTAFSESSLGSIQLK